MDIYLIRHGQTEYNKKHLHQSADIPLTDLGKRQAEAIIGLLKDINPTHIISSPYTRALETAQIATKELSKEVEQNELFVELKRADSIIGRHHFSPASLRYLINWFSSKNEFYESQERGESRLAFLNRLHDAKEHLESLPSDARVVVFSHSVFINYFVQHICNEKPISSFKALLLLLKIKALDNSSLTHTTYDPNLVGKVCKWNLVNFDVDGHVIT